MMVETEDVAKRSHSPNLEKKVVSNVPNLTQDKQHTHAEEAWLSSDFDCDDAL